MQKICRQLLFPFLMLMVVFCSSCMGVETMVKSPADPPPECEGLTTIRSSNVEDVVSITYIWHTEGGPIEKTITDEETLKEVYPLLCAIEVGEKSSVSCTDQGLGIKVEYKNQSSAGIRFEGDNIVIDLTEYDAENLGDLRKYLRERDEEEEFQKDLF